MSIHRLAGQLPFIGPEDISKLQMDWLADEGVDGWEIPIKDEADRRPWMTRCWAARMVIVQGRREYRSTGQRDHAESPLRYFRRAHGRSSQAMGDQ